ncbi:(S)-2-haloacid dehalogenase 4A [Madurella mycetomatis]|uniref:(S)-2-haloacid dehalogenase 4A n=1 Tax=Madurella mycetomatis TaxID=100816 RepID=A0A175VR74_9PEZI|nr:(S)-2-haloacid dehalogenase 4A [Madurella mycetomatis]
MTTSNPLRNIKAFTFDIFGTVVDWRTSITTALVTAAARKLTSPSFPLLPRETQSRLQSLTAEDWSRFAQEWRDAYGDFTRGFEPEVTAWKDVDAHHRDSLVSLLVRWRLAGVYGAEEIAALSGAWHSLGPWPDSARGIRALSGRGGRVVAALSNGNRALLADLDRHGRLGFDRLISAEDFKAYKPHRDVYLGACRILGVEPAEVAMVAAHLGDLAGARAAGMRTVYVQRPGEKGEDEDEERHVQAKQWVDLWVAQGEGGIEEVARRLGV